jgi:ATP-dependent protease ClpP protease subunit
LSNSYISLFALLACIAGGSFAQNSTPKSETYFIDDLTITTKSDMSGYRCVTGGIHSILVSGSIGPDSTFAVGKLIDQRKPCKNASGEVITPIKVVLESGGGVLDDGYKLGELFRAKGVITLIPDDKMCASSCAVAFLGGKRRIVANSGSILFHAPYLKQMSIDGRAKITCDIPDKELEVLKNYYSRMTTADTGDRLFERTMWYCSAEDGWTIKGSGAASLYGIATEKWVSEFVVICQSTTSLTYKYLESNETCPIGFTFFGKQLYPKR